MSIGILATPRRQVPRRIVEDRYSEVDALQLGDITEARAKDDRGAGTCVKTRVNALLFDAAPAFRWQTMEHLECLVNQKRWPEESLEHSGGVLARLLGLLAIPDQRTDKPKSVDSASALVGGRLPSSDLNLGSVRRWVVYIVIHRQHRTLPVVTGKRNLRPYLAEGVWERISLSATLRRCRGLCG